MILIRVHSLAFHVASEYLPRGEDAIRFLIGNFGYPAVMRARMITSKESLKSLHFDKRPAPYLSRWDLLRLDELLKRAE